MWKRVCIFVTSSAAVIGIAVFPAPEAAQAGSVTASSRSSSASATAIHGVPLNSSYENANRAISRDIGVSVALPDGHELWLFGDTAILTLGSDGSWHITGFIDGSTAMLARLTRGQVPHGGEYPFGVPSRFISSPNDVYLPDGSGHSCVKGGHQRRGVSRAVANWRRGMAEQQG
jgi:hypothetical protein